MKLDITTAPKRNSRHWKPGQIDWQDIIGWCQTPDDKKEAGNYVLGSFQTTTVRHPKEPKDCTDYHRTKMSVLSRSAITLDVDTPDPGFADMVELTLPWQALIHTTFSSTEEAPRYRLIIPLDRLVAPDEYHTAASAVMQRLGEQNFDPGSVQPERYMFKPAANDPANFWWAEISGDVAKADDLLVDFKADLSSLPLPKKSRNKRDPFALEGTIGAFNRAYRDIDKLIEAYKLPYTKLAEDRYQLAGSVGAAGMGPVRDTEGLYFSHHTTDPAYDVTCSAFDLARLHLYGDMDEDLPASHPVNRRPSHKAMLEKATEDVNVVRELLGADFEDDLTATADGIQQDSWWLGFSLDNRTGQPVDHIHNWDLIAQNDKVFQNLYFNELSMAIESKIDLPWRRIGKGLEIFTNADRGSLALHIERTYHIRPGRTYLDSLIDDVVMQRRVNPVLEYLKGLKWDGKPRVETCLPGVQPTEYTRFAARKSLAAAVARMFEPGIKWDHMLIMHGNEGLGKSRWVEKMARGYSANLERINNKDTLITLQANWIMTSDEGHSLKKADFDQQKEFITRTGDHFRMPYERESRMHPRHCVIWGTTNPGSFLRKQEGNRRFLIVKCEDKVDVDTLTDEYIDQVWAEAVVLYRAGEALWLDDEESDMAKEEREEFTEENASEGLIEDYLDTLVPEDWWSKSPEARQEWLLSASDGFTAPGVDTIDRVCSLQVWVEALGRRRGDHNRVDLLEINAVLKELPGWRLLPGRHRLAGYGPQTVFERITEPDEDDLI